MRGTGQERFDSTTARLRALRVVPASEFMGRQAPWDKGGATSHRHTAAAPSPCTDTAFPDEREYRFCKAVFEHPLRPSSSYAELAGMSSKTAVAVRKELIARGLLRERRVDPAGRGRATILLEITDEGLIVIARYEAKGARQA
jgi:hypothetical protein